MTDTPTPPQTVSGGPESVPQPRRGAGRQPEGAETPQAAVQGFAAVQGRCPACGWSSLFLGAGGHVTCSRIDCPNPCAADDLLHHTDPIECDHEAALGQAQAELARLRAGEEPHTDPVIQPTSGQFLYRFNEASAARRLEVIDGMQTAARRGTNCFIAGHEAAVDDLADLLRRRTAVEAAADRAEQAARLTPVDECRIVHSSRASGLREALRILCGEPAAYDGADNSRGAIRLEIDLNARTPDGLVPVHLPAGVTVQVGQLVTAFESEDAVAAPAVVRTVALGQALLDVDWNAIRDDGDAHDAATLTALQQRLENAETRLQLARQALAADGYFDWTEIGPDIAPRISEWLTHHNGRVEQAETAINRVRQIANRLRLDSPWGRATGADILTALDEQPGSTATQATEPDDTDMTEADIDHAMATGTPVTIVPPREHCGELSPAVPWSTVRTECVLHPHHHGSHADDVGCRWTTASPGFYDGPTVAECAANDRNYDVEQDGE